MEDHTVFTFVTVSLLAVFRQTFSLVCQVFSFTSRQDSGIFKGSVLGLSSVLFFTLVTHSTTPSGRVFEILLEAFRTLHIPGCSAASAPRLCSELTGMPVQATLAASRRLLVLIADH
ncbi:hypothetical protein RvY_10270 [Ramazzottius varieornatus]|uniref:Uncharacterized protein n=1 Tax=Ramazzottius varieornatus TaxID=947166 RepID=A0A1D1VL86_RAMVA|nr:hypothetical protein RvY_10270 [Ramazzottius varieornatus]